MFKRIATFITISAMAIALSGCARNQAPVNGFMFSDVKGPLMVTSSAIKPTRVGRSSMKSVLGIFASGDASIEAAAKIGGITEIHHVDYESRSTFGLMSEYTTVVYGN